MSLCGCWTQLSDALAPSAPKLLEDVPRGAVNNKCPIVLVHGFAGQAETSDGVRYWGRSHGDIADKLELAGHKVFTVSIGPFSSNWDRACELYAQIKGGRVDYGEKHSAHHGHERFGRELPGLYPEWGEKDAHGRIRKVHLVGHSLGGTTIRMLAQLLAHGTKGAPIDEDPASNSLFEGGKDWVLSVTTISSPNQGTTLLDGFSSISDTIENALAIWFAVRGLTAQPGATLFDPHLDQWGITPRQEDEGVSAYIHRILGSRMFAPGFKDIVAWSGCTEGAKEENAWVTTLPNVYYYSISGQCTIQTTSDEGEPIVTADSNCMSLELRAFSAFMTSDFTTKLGFPESWKANDGTINTVSMASDGHGPVIDFDGRSLPGHWMKLPLLTHMDHLTIVGSQKEVDPTDLYCVHAAILAGLPVSGRNGTAVVAPAELVTRLKQVITHLNNREEPESEDAAQTWYPHALSQDLTSVGASPTVPRAEPW
ncbi:hypothetical protein Poli38472_013706 [Pythium oligandrum]|uniref:Lipase-like C-terminal domain-containing protein n=1 Tax=Pythium oligandrum TaxID=41045 RepID=A0A8K1FK01_PYTOL|nr:hypothetical protein Poli38472_013706 [Pythium oligandrum]|eukprot:TMW61243.1 hypothetical protein Poli38472_013706 [Pythium oligandrum]